MKRLRKLVTFSLDDRKFALYVSAVQRIVRVVEVTALPKAPEIVVGIINLQGQVIPVFDIRMRFHLPAREVQLNDQLIIATTTKRTVALIVDSVNDVIEITLGARIMAVSDIFTALAEDRPYRSGMEAERIKTILQEQADRGFQDPRIIKLLFENMEEVRKAVKERQEQARYSYQIELEKAE